MNVPSGALMPAAWELAWREGMVMSLGKTIRRMAADPMMLSVSGTHALILLAGAVENALQQAIDNEVARVTK